VVHIITLGFKDLIVPAVDLGVSRVTLFVWQSVGVRHVTAKRTGGNICYKGTLVVYLSYNELIRDLPYLLRFELGTSKIHGWCTNYDFSAVCS